MALSVSRVWTLFKLLRVLVYSLATLLSIAWSAIYAVLLLRGWNSYDGDQRCIVIIMLVIYSISSAVLYLMQAMVIRFRLWLDAVRVASVLIFQVGIVGGTVTFALFSPTFPCNNLGSVSTCKMIEDFVIFGSWSLSALLLIYALCLAVMFQIPMSASHQHFEAALVFNSEKSTTLEKGEKRSSWSSIGSNRTIYSQGSYIGSYISANPRRNSTISTRPTNTISTKRDWTTNRTHIPPFDYYRSATPGSMRSFAPSSVSTIRDSTRQRYYNSHGIPAPVPRMAPMSTYLDLPLPLLSNAPPSSETSSRQGTPTSMMSSQTRPSGYRGDQQKISYLLPPGLGHSSPGTTTPQPPLYTRSTSSPTPSVMAASHASIHVPSPPYLIMHKRGAQVTQLPNQLPSSRSIASTGSVDRIPLSRSGSASSVPRSPSPFSENFHNIPTTPMSAVLPTHPGLPYLGYNAGQIYKVREIERPGSAPAIHVIEMASYSKEQPRSRSEYHNAPPRNWAGVSTDGET